MTTERRPRPLVPGALAALLLALLHHTDDEREVAYDRGSPFGRLDQGLEVPAEEGWVVVDMAADWAVVFDQPERSRRATSSAK